MRKFTLLFLLAMAFGVARASVITFMPNNNYFDGTTNFLYLDVNNDGFNDFLFTSQPNSSGVQLSWFKVKALTSGSKILTDGTGKVNGLNDSVLISTQIPSNLWADSALVYQNIAGPYPYPVNVYTNMAFRFADGSGNHFGYLRGLCQWIPAPSEGFDWFLINRVGYETAVDGPIKAGSMTSLVGIPEPEVPQFSVAQGVYDGLHITFDRNVYGDLQILDLQGKNLATFAVRGQTADILAPYLSSGVYLLQFTSTRMGQPLRITRKVVL